MSEKESAARRRRKERLARARDERIEFICGQREQAEPTAEEIAAREKAARERLEREMAAMAAQEKARQADTVWRKIGIAAKNVLWIVMMVAVYKLATRERNALTVSPVNGLFGTWNVFWGKYTGFLEEGNGVVFGEGLVGTVRKCVAGEKERCCDAVMDNLANAADAHSIKARTSCVFTVDSNGSVTNVVRRDILGKLIVSLPAWLFFPCVGLLVALFFWSLFSRFRKARKH